MYMIHYYYILSFSTTFSLFVTLNTTEISTQFSVGILVLDY